jgi:hypothetical protein
MRTMIWGAAAAGLLVAAAPAAAQDAGDAKPITFSCAWKVGAKRTYERVKTREDVRANGASGTNKSTTPFTVEVLEKLPEGGHVVAWTWGETAFEASVPVTPLMKRFNNLAKGMRLELEVDAQGGVQKLRNAAAVQKKFAEAIEMIRGELEGMGLDPQALEATLKTLGSPEVATQSAIKEPQVFFMGSGGEMIVGQPIAYEDQLPNAYGGEPFPSKASFTLTKADDATQQLHIEWKQELDPVKTIQILKTTLEKRFGREIPDAQLPKYSITDKAGFVVERASAWPVKVTHSRRIVSGPAKRVDGLEFTLTSKDAAGK